MATKKELTVWLDEDLIDAAEEYARKHETTLSALILDFLSRLVSIPKGAEPSTALERLTGTLPENVSTDDYHEGLYDKYLADDD